MNLMKGISKKGVENAILALKEAQCVFFDVDSTIIFQEGLDEFARFLGKYDEVDALTKTAMSGKMSYVQAFDMRMRLLSPSLHEFNSFLNIWRPQFTPGVNTFIKQLSDDNKHIVLISGGIFELLQPIFHSLNIPEDCVFCNRLIFENQKYKDFERDLLINQPFGKRAIIQHYMKKNNLNHCVMIGDGSTDLETMPVVDCFIGYGGVVERTIVKEQAPVFVTSFSSLHSLYSS